MSCIETSVCWNGVAPQEERRRSGVWLTGLGLSLTLWLGACSNTSLTGMSGAPATLAQAPQHAEEAMPSAALGTGHAPAGAGVGGDAASGLPPPKPVRTHDELRLQAAQRLVAANPDITYMGEVPDELLAIPVLEVELYRDGRVKHVTVLRVPTQAKDTVDIAIAAIHKAAPYGDLSRLPEPRKFTETFLFDDDRRFKPRTLDK